MQKLPQRTCVAQRIAGKVKIAKVDIKSQNSCSFYASILCMQPNAGMNKISANLHKIDIRSKVDMGWKLLGNVIVSIFDQIKKINSGLDHILVIPEK